MLSTLLAFVATSTSFVVLPHLTTSPSSKFDVRTSSPSLNVFDSLFKSIFDDRKARASHVLLKGPDAEIACLALKDKIDSGEISFADAAREYSRCPSARSGGDLGTFKPGAMVPEFDLVVFDENVPLGEVRLCNTKFGSHLIQVVERTTPQSE